MAFVLLVIAITATVVWGRTIVHGIQEIRSRQLTGRPNHSYIWLTVKGIISFAAAGFFWFLAFLTWLFGTF